MIQVTFGTIKMERKRFLLISKEDTTETMMRNQGVKWDLRFISKVEQKFTMCKYLKCDLG